MAEKDNPELTSSHRHTEATSISTAINSENDLKTGRRDLPQLIIERKTH